MAEPITTAIGILAVKELAPPIMRETLKAHRERLDDRIAHMSDVCKALNAPEVVEKVMVGAAIVSSLSNVSLACTVAIGVIKGVDRYTKS